MKRKFISLLILSLVVLVVLFGIAFAAQQTGKKNGYSLATAGQASAYNVIGHAIADVVSSANNFALTAETTGGSIQNIELMAKDHNMLALVQNDVLHWASMGEMMFKGKRNSRLRLLASLYDEPLFLVARKAANIKSPADLKGKRICVGTEGSGNEAESIVVLDIAGLDLNKDFPGHDVNKDFRHLHGTYPTMAKLLNEGKVDACFVMGNSNFQNLRKACANTPLEIVNFPTAMLDKLTAKYPCFWYHIIPANTYDNDDMVQTPCVMAMLVADYQLPDEVVTGILTALFDKANLEKVKATNESASRISLEDACLALSVPYHPAAVKFYTDKGKLIK